jgi:Protein of unknown function (DUF2961)/HEAT repeats/HEAT repeat
MRLDCRGSRPSVLRARKWPVASLIALLLALPVEAWPQVAPTDPSDGLGLARLKNYSTYRVSSGNRDVKSNDDSKRIMPGETLVMADITGPGMITHLWLTVAQNEFGWPRLLRLRVYYDGHKTPSVDAPLGDFFAVGHGAERNVSSAMIENSSFGRARNSYWPMPFHTSCRITVTNEGHRFVPMFYYHVDYRKYRSLPADIAYFHAYFRQERPARAGHHYEFLNIRGTGHYVGTVLSVVQTQPSWFGEGDDLFYIDGATLPQIYGTGTEDYFNQAWDLRNETSTWTGTPIAEGELAGSRLSAYRWHVPDPIAFTQSIRAEIEHSGWTANPDGSVRSGFEERPDYFSSVAFWYQKGVNEGLPEPPYGDERLPFGNATQVAIEDSIQDITAEGGKVSVQRDVDWSKDLLFFAANGEGAKIDVPIDIPDNGRYAIVAEIAQAPDYGDYIGFIDQQPANIDTRKPTTSEIPRPGPDVYHNYLPEVYVASDRPMGMLDLSKGRHILTFTCVGKDPHSAGYHLGINDIVIQRVPDATESADSMTPLAQETRNSGVLFRGHPLQWFLQQLQSASGLAKIPPLRAIGSFGSDGGAAIAPLVSLLADPSPQVRAAAASALGQVGNSSHEAVLALSTALSDPSPSVREFAALGLKAGGPKAASAVPILVRLLSDPIDYVRATAADALGAVGPGASVATEPLAKRLTDQDEQGFVRMSAAYALGDIGPGARDALPVLQQAVVLRRIGAAAQEAILKIEGKPVAVYHR